MIKRADWLAITKDRMAVMLFLAMGLLAVIIIITTVLRVHPSDIQVPVRFSGFGQSNIGRDQWYTQYSYAGFAVLVVAINGYLATKLYTIKRMVSLGLVGMGVFLLVLALLIANAVFNLAPTV